MVICPERCVDLHTAQLMPLPLAVSCFSKIQIGFTFLVLARLGSPGQRAVKRVCVCVVCCRTEPQRFTEREFEEDIVKRHLPRSRLSAGLLVVDDSTFETIRQKLVLHFLAYLFEFVMLIKGLTTLFSP